MKIISTHLFGKTKVGMVDIIHPFKKQEFVVFRLLRKLLTLFHLEFLLINKKIIKSIDDDFIIFDGAITISFLKWISKEKKQNRLILWLWNPVGKTISVDKVPSNIEIWSYSKSDCKKYNFKWNSTFLDWSSFDNCKSVDPKYDCVYIGRKKRQTSLLNKIKTYLDDHNISNSLLITRKNKFDVFNLYLPSPVSYAQYLTFQSSGRTIIDIGQTKDVGLTLRALEAMKLERKIICNYIEPLDSLIPKENIYYIDDDFSNLNKIKDFVKKDFVKPSQNFFRYYSFDSWLERFKK